MKILIANKFHYRRGGDCVYALNLADLLRSKGHEVAEFAMNCHENLPSDYSAFFPSEVEFKLGPSMFKALRRSLGGGEVAVRFNALLDAFRPDVVHLGNIHTQLSPVLAEIACSRGIRVVWTLHDYKLLCPRYDCLKKGAEVCESCFSDASASKWPVLRHSCMKNSFPASVMAFIEAGKWTRKRLSACVDAFICPSLFMRQKMLQGGFPEDKLVHLCNFMDVSGCGGVSLERGGYCCFVGRLSHEKGVGTLVKAASMHPDRHFVIVGDGPLRETLEAEAGTNVEFVGRKDWDGIKEIVGHARFAVIPSEWYENNPLSVIEAQCLGTPVLGADIGGIPELLTDGRGMTFRSGDVQSLSSAIGTMFASDPDYLAIADSARSEYGSDAYYESIMAIYGA